MSESRMVVPARYDRVKQICSFVAAAAARAGLNESAIDDCQLAVDEACTNIIEHGYGAEDKGNIEVVCSTVPGTLKIELRDQAPPFDITQVPDPQLDKAIEDTSIGGLGIFFIKKKMDEVSYEHKDGTNRLLLVKRRTAQS